MLDALVALRQEIPGLAGLDRLAAVHIDHGLHPESPAWVERCAARCAELAIPLLIDWPETGPRLGEGIEAWGHRIRRALFGRLLQAGEVLLLAQHRDDQAETLLLALMRGSGPRGLAAMPELAPLGEGRVFRPFLDLDRADLAEYARARGLGWIDDPSNAETCFDRNYLRHQVIPLLRARWPALGANLARSARLCAEASVLADRLADQALQDLSGPWPQTLSLERLKALDRPLAKAALRLWIRRQGFQVPDARRLELLLDQLIPTRPDAQPLVSWSGCEIRRYRDTLWILRPLPPAPAVRLNWQLGDRPSRLELPAGLGSLRWEPASDKPSGEVVAQVRFSGQGLVCRLHPAGPRHALKKVFQEQGIPPWLRPLWPMVFIQGQLIALPGLVACCPDRPAAPLGTLIWQDCPWQRFWPELIHPLAIALG